MPGSTSGGIAAGWTSPIWAGIPQTAVNASSPSAVPSWLRRFSLASTMRASMPFTTSSGVNWPPGHVVRARRGAIILPVDRAARGDDDRKAEGPGRRERNRVGDARCVRSLLFLCCQPTPEVAPAERLPNGGARGARWCPSTCARGERRQMPATSVPAVAKSTAQRQRDLRARARPWALNGFMRYVGGARCVGERYWTPRPSRAAASVNTVVPRPSAAPSTGGAALLSLIGMPLQRFSAPAASREPACRVHLGNQPPAHGAGPPPLGPGSVGDTEAGAAPW